MVKTILTFPPLFKAVERHTLVKQVELLEVVWKNELSCPAEVEDVPEEAPVAVDEVMILHAVQYDRNRTVEHFPQARLREPGRDRIMFCIGSN